MLKRVIEFFEQAELQASFANCFHGVNNPYHLENDCLSHTLLVVNSAAKIANRERLTDFEREALFWASVFHDAGKPITRFTDERGKVRFNGHEYLSALIWLDWAKRLQIEDEIVQTVAKIILYHTLAHKNLARHNYAFLNDTEYRLLTLLQEADDRGRITLRESHQPSLKGESNYVGYRENREVILLFGLPNSGKSTWLQNIKDGVILSRDAIIEEYARQNGITYNEAFKQLNQQEVSKEFERRLRAARDEQKVYIDMTNLVKRWRRKTLNDLLAPQRKKYVTILIFLTGWQEILKRNAARVGKEIPYNVLLQMVRSTTPPLLDEANEIQFVFT